MFGSKQSREGGASRNPLMRAVERQTDRQDEARYLELGLDRVAERPMTTTGAVVKTAILTLLMLVTAAYGFTYPNPLLLWGGMIGGFVCVLIGSMRPAQARWAAPAYALCEGLFVGVVTAMFAATADGIVLQAVSLTVATLFAMLFLYQSGLIKVTAKLRAGVMMATFAIAGVYLLAIVLGFFGVQMPFLHEGGTIGIVISLVILGVAAMNLLLDFDNIETGAARGLPARYEWVFAMGLLVTLVWIYIELLRLLSYLQRD